MSFAWPHLLWLLLAPAALLGWEHTHRRRIAALAGRPKILRAEAGTHSLRLLPAEAGPASPGTRPRFWLGLGLALVIVALARPQWGRLEEPVFDQSREILIAVDLSRSMLAEDVRPSRLERAKLLIQSLLERLAGERVGLVVFAGTAFLQSPLSADYEILREFLPALGPDFLPEGGTNYRALLDTSLGAYAGTTTADRFLIILSDGEATDTDWRSRIEELKTKNVRVLGLGVGTAAGAMIPDDAGGLVKDERGAVVLSKLESATLQELAQSTDGVYRDASAWVDLAALITETVERGRTGTFVETNTVRLVERFQWPLALGLWCLLVSFCYEYPVRPRPRAITLRAGVPPARKTGPAVGTRESATPSAVATLLVLLFASFALLPTPHARAALPAGHPPAGAKPPVETEPSALAKIVSRLSAAENLTGRDLAEFARETVTWGSRLKSEQQSVPEGPIRDGLAAVDQGSQLDTKTADWAKLRQELEELLRKPDEEEQQQQPPQDENEPNKDQKQKNQNQKNQDQQKQDQKQPGDPQSQPPEKQDSPSEKQDAEPGDQQPPGESAFGDMQPKDAPPPPPPGDTQKVGGTPEQKGEPPESIDPALALPLQKLEQLRNQDSPAELFQLMEGERRPAKQPGKNW